VQILEIQLSSLATLSFRGLPGVFDFGATTRAICCIQNVKTGRRVFENTSRRGPLGHFFRFEMERSARLRLNGCGACLVGHCAEAGVGLVSMRVSAGGVV